MKKTLMLIIIVLFGGLFGGLSVHTHAAELEKPSEYIRYMKFGWKIGSSRIPEIKIEADWVKHRSFPGKDYQYQINVYHLNGKLFCTKKYSSRGLYYIIPKKVTKTGKKVYYFKVRVLHNNVPVTTWTNPIYFFRCAKKHIKVKVSSFSTKTWKLTIKVKTPKVKGIKKYEVVIHEYAYRGKDVKKRVKAGKTVIFKNVDSTYKDYTDINYYVQLRPVFTHKSDNLIREYKHKKVPTNFEVPPSRNIYIKFSKKQ